MAPDTKVPAGRTDGKTDGQRQNNIPLPMAGNNNYEHFRNLNSKCDGQTDRRTATEHVKYQANRSMLTTDRQTDRPTSSKTIYPLFFEAGHNYSILEHSL
ncbi:hypothetical protein DPMN_004347 [Dreissena polymorpha]|uniref:Uncharacterized protein n=1 Tax=Dreissena polymorpha TaxID=45954 RepID=A0A9D4MQ30_DREPO|nr:hypothetical protein DPMN_004347 [Dreissena polymorpha]